MKSAQITSSRFAHTFSPDLDDLEVLPYGNDANGCGDDAEDDCPEDFLCYRGPSVGNR